VLFQTLDNKNECVGIFLDGNLLYDELPEGLSKTWRYASFLSDRDIEYASLYCLGQSLDEVCPEDLKEDWASISGRLKAFLTSFQEAKISLDENCFFEMVPDRFLLEYCDIKNEITKSIFRNFFRPKNYRFLVDLTKVLEDIKYQQLNINPSALGHRLGSSRARTYIKRIKQYRSNVVYNTFGTKTGRLTTTRDSFPILTFDKNYRSMLQPNNDYFVELDYNAAELRTVFGLLSIDQPENDIHEWITNNIYGSKLTRDESKKKTFAWLYNPAYNNAPLEKVFDRNKILEKFWDGQTVKTPFGRNIEADHHHAFNYIMQSSTSDLFLRKMIDIHKMLENRKSNIAFCIHDSLVLDFSAEDKDLFGDLVREFSDTALGNFKTNVSVGKSFGEMKELKWTQ